MTSVLLSLLISIVMVVHFQLAGELKYKLCINPKKQLDTEDTEEKQETKKHTAGAIFII